MLGTVKTFGDIRACLLSKSLLKKQELILVVDKDEEIFLWQFLQECREKR